MNTFTERSAVASGEVFFQQLPVFDPDPALWVRIQALDQRHRQRRRIRFAALAGGLATLLAALALVVPGGPWHPAESADLALRQATSQQLQEQLASVASARADVSALSDLRVIDAALQAAYDRNATDDELDALWIMRNGALRALGADAGPSRSVTRI